MKQILIRMNDIVRFLEQTLRMNDVVKFLEVYVIQRRRKKLELRQASENKYQ